MWLLQENILKLYTFWNLMTGIPAWILKYFLCHSKSHGAFLCLRCFEGLFELEDVLNDVRFLHWLRKPLHLRHGSIPQHLRRPWRSLLLGPSCNYEDMYQHCLPLDNNYKLQYFLPMWFFMCQFFSYPTKVLFLS